MTFQWWLVQNGITVTVLFPVVWILCRLLRGQPAAHHWLWLVRMVKLILPPLAEWPVHNEELFGFDSPLELSEPIETESSTIATGQTSSIS